MTTLITALIGLVIFGVIVYLIDNYVPMAPPIKTIFKVVVVLVLVVWLLQLFGIYTLPIR